MSSLLSDEEFLKLEKDFKFLSRARETFGDLGKLPYVVVDIETTGLSPENHEIIEIGAFKTEKGELKDTYNALIKPVEIIPPEIEAMTGISMDMVSGQPTISEILPKFFEFIGDSILVAHNTDFDISFLKYHSSKWLNKVLNNPSICTVKLTQKLLPTLENHKLHTVAKHFNIPISNRHRAMGDAEITLHLWNKLINNLRERGVYTLKDLENF